MLKVWADVAWSDYCKFFEENKKKQIKMIHELITDIDRNGEDKGRGQPEPLKYELTGYWSRRIDLANRLVYKIDGDKLCIIQCGTHYHQKK